MQVELLAPVFVTVVCFKLSNMHQKNVIDGMLRTKYLNKSLNFGIVIPCLIMINGANKMAANKNLINIKTSEGSSFVMRAPTGNELAANSIVMIIKI